jgi:hypothetical protein
LDVVAINAAIVGLRAGHFRSHLMRERPRMIQRLYEEFEKYFRSDNDFSMCMEEQSQQKSTQKLTNPGRGNGPIQKCLARQSLERVRPGRRKRPRKPQSTG